MRSAGLVVIFMTVLVTAGCDVVGATARGNPRFEVPSESMQPTIRRGQVVEARRVAPGKYRPHRGDIVIFRANDWSDEGALPGALQLKRVIAIGGDTIRCCSRDGGVVLNGAALSEPYLATPDEEFPFGPVTVPPGRLWVMGDHRAISFDSRGHLGDAGGGTVAAADVIDVVRLPG